MDGERVDGGEAAAGSERERLIAGRLRQSAAAAAPTTTELLSEYALNALLEGDVGHLHRAGDLRAAPIESHRRIAGPAVVAGKRALRRSLHPLIETQSSVNAANARVVTLLLTQLAAQAHAIERLEDELAELRSERER